MVRSRPRILRAFAVVLALRAAKALPHAHSGWQRVLVREVQSISSDIEALIWAIGCLWAIRVERLIGKSQPGPNCILLLTGLLLAAHSLLRPLVSGLAASGGGVLPTDAPHGLFVLLLFLCAVALVAGATPGTGPRRVFCAAAFPFLALLGLLSVSLGGDVVHALLPEAGSPLYTILFGPLFGGVVALVLALPCVLLYREVAAPTAALALIPAMVKRLDAEGLTRVLDLHNGLFDQFWPFLCSLIIVAIFSRVFLIWVSRAPGEHASTAA